MLALALKIMQILSESPQPSHVIARRLRLPQRYVTSILRELIRVGLVTATASAKEKILYCLTDRGREIVTSPDAERKLAEILAGARMSGPVKLTVTLSSEAAEKLNMIATYAQMSPEETAKRILEAVLDFVPPRAAERDVVLEKIASANRLCRLVEEARDLAYEMQRKLAERGQFDDVYTYATQLIEKLKKVYTALSLFAKTLEKLA